MRGNPHVRICGGRRVIAASIRHRPQEIVQDDEQALTIQMESYSNPHRLMTFVARYQGVVVLYASYFRSRAGLKRSFGALVRQAKLGASCRVKVPVG